MFEPFNYRRAAKYIHTGKHDYDDGREVSNNATKKRTIRKLKRQQRRESIKWMTED